MFDYSDNYIKGFLQVEFVCSKEFALSWKLTLPNNDNHDSNNDNHDSYQTTTVTNPLSHRV